MNKPVWRMNTGNEIPRDEVVSVLFRNGAVSEKPQSIGVRVFDFSIQGLWDDVIAYKTTLPPRKAKYERVDCDECMGSSNEIDWEDENCLPIDGTKCQPCNGKGYTLEAVK